MKIQFFSRKRVFDDSEKLAFELRHFATTSNLIIHNFVNSCGIYLKLRMTSYLITYTDVKCCTFRMHLSGVSGKISKCGNIIYLYADIGIGCILIPRFQIDAALFFQLDRFWKPVSLSRRSYFELSLPYVPRVFGQFQKVGNILL